MITPFDLWGYGKYRYTFRMRCEEQPDLYLEDGIGRIFLNTRGTNDGEVNPELAELLHYMENSTDETAEMCRSEKVRELHRRVSEVKASEEFEMCIRDRYYHHRRKQLCHLRAEDGYFRTSVPVLRFRGGMGLHGQRHREGGGGPSA